MDWIYISQIGFYGFFKAPKALYTIHSHIHCQRIMDGSLGLCDWSLHCQHNFHVSKILKLLNVMWLVIMCAKLQQNSNSFVYLTIYDNLLKI